MSLEVRVIAHSRYKASERPRQFLANLYTELANESIASVTALILLSNF
jgi:hypothetical protein